MIFSTQSTKLFFGHNSPEIELLLACARTSLDSNQRTRINSLMQKPLDWHYLLNVATRHRVLPLLYWNLHSVCPEQISTPELHRLREYFRVNSLRNEFLAKELVKLLHLFQTHEIPALPFKGPILTSVAYGNLSLRTFEDLDILIQKQDLERAYQVLGSQNYKRKRVSENEEVSNPQHSKYHTFVGGNGLVNIDLQWMIAGSHFSFSLDHRQWWERLQVVSLNGSMVPSLPPEESLLILCVHGSKHIWERLMWICDVAEVVRTYGRTMDWSHLLEEAHRLDCQRMLFLGLILAKDLLGTDLPERVLPLLKKEGPNLTPLCAKVHKELFPESAIFSNPTTDISLWHLSMRDRWQSRIWFYFYLCISRNLSTTDCMLLPHPSLFRLFYSICQPIRFIGKYGLPLPRMKQTLSSWLERMG